MPRGLSCGHPLNRVIAMASLESRVAVSLSCMCLVTYFLIEPYGSLVA